MSSSDLVRGSIAPHTPAGAASCTQLLDPHLAGMLRSVAPVEGSMLAELWILGPSPRMTVECVALLGARTGGQVLRCSPSGMHIAADASGASKPPMSSSDLVRTSPGINL